MDYTKSWGLLLFFLKGYPKDVKKPIETPKLTGCVNGHCLDFSSEITNTLDGNQRF
jgi:hypothetical protein